MSLNTAPREERLKHDADRDPFAGVSGVDHVVLPVNVIDVDRSAFAPVQRHRLVEAEPKAAPEEPGTDAEARTVPTGPIPAEMVPVTEMLMEMPVFNTTTAAPIMVAMAFAAGLVPAVLTAVVLTAVVLTF